jgi:hypothetical protein
MDTFLRLCLKALARIPPPYFFLSLPLSLSLSLSWLRPLSLREAGAAC